MITEDQLEQLCLSWFQAIGYDTVCGYDIAPDGDSPERSDYRQIVLFERLLAQLQEIRETFRLKSLSGDLTLNRTSMNVEKSA